MNDRNGKSFEEPSETPEEIVGLIVNLANRPDLHEIQERQIREIKILIARERTEYIEHECEDCENGIKSFFDPLFGVWAHDSQDAYIGATICLKMRGKPLKNYEK